MNILPILHYPDARLRAACAPVADFGPALAALAADMLETMYAAPGRGLAAPQVGQLLRMFVMDTGWKDGARDPLVFVNPVIDAQSDTLAVMEEGCLSIPGVMVPVARPDAVRMRWQALDGAWHVGAFTGIAAVCAQHEHDHLDGRLTLDHLDGLARATLLAGYAPGPAPA